MGGPNFLIHEIICSAKAKAPWRDRNFFSFKITMVALKKMPVLSRKINKFYVFLSY